MNLAAVLSEHPFADDDTLVHTPSSSLTKAEVERRVEELACRVAPLVEGTRPVAVIADGSDALIGMIACWRAGAVYVPINPRQPEAAVAETIKRTNVVAVVAGDRIHTRPGGIVHPDGTALVLWTSGTTGQPKAVLHAHEGYFEIIDRVLAPLRGKPRDTNKAPSPNLIPVSMSLNAGIYNALFGLRAGAPLVMMDGFSTSEFAVLVERHGIRSTVLPPAAMAMLSDDASIESLGPLRYVRSITAALSPFQARRFAERFGVTVLNGYGQAEIGEVIGWTATDAKEFPDKIGAIGRPHRGVDIQLAGVDDNGVGELLVRPPSMAAGYSDGADLDDRLTDEGFVRTGDLARVDDEGFVWIEGRLSDLINRGGNKVFPEEVEEVIAAIPGVREAAVVAAPDERLGEVPVAFVAGSPEVDLETACRAHLVPYKVPVRFEPIDELPRNEVGKILRKDLAARL